MAALPGQDRKLFLLLAKFRGRLRLGKRSAKKCLRKLTAVLDCCQKNFQNSIGSFNVPHCAHRERSTSASSV
jgi:hypothetical protein